MTARLNLVFAILSAVFAFGFTAAAPNHARAGTTSGGGGCCVVTPPCCHPTPPPCCTPSPPPTCCGGGHQINIPSVNVNVGATVIVNANASATAIGVAGARGQAGAVFYGGGGSSFGVTQSSGLISGLNVEGSQVVRTPYSATRTRIRTVIIQAVCIDDQEIPHPASQVSPDKEILDAYEGEIFRCIAGSHMQWTMADFTGKIAFDHGQVMNCAKGEALYKSQAGELSCKPQRPARDCNERSLLRRFGAGIKIIKIVTVETYEAYREQTVTSGTASAAGMSIDGGVGGIVY